MILQVRVTVTLVAVADYPWYTCARAQRMRLQKIGTLNKLIELILRHTVHFFLQFQFSFNVHVFT